MKNLEIKLQWKGLKGKEAEIGTFVVDEKTYNKLDNLFGFDISIDVYDETNEKPTQYKDVVDSIKNTKYGKLAMKENLTKEQKLRSIIREELKKQLNEESYVTMAAKASGPNSSIFVLQRLLRMNIPKDGFDKFAKNSEVNKLSTDLLRLIDGLLSK